MYRPSPRTKVRSGASKYFGGERAEAPDSACEVHRAVNGLEVFLVPLSVRTSSSGAAETARLRPTRERAREQRAGGHKDIQAPLATSVAIVMSYTPQQHKPATSDPQTAPAMFPA